MALSTPSTLFSKKQEVQSTSYLAQLQGAYAPLPADVTLGKGVLGLINIGLTVCFFVCGALSRKTWYAPICSTVRLATMIKARGGRLGYCTYGPRSLRSPAGLYGLSDTTSLTRGRAGERKQNKVIELYI